MMGVYFLFVVELTIVFFLGTIFNFLTDGLFSKQGMNKVEFWTIFLGIIILLFAYNVFRYVNKEKIKSIIKKFENKPLNQKIKTWQIFTVPILILFISIALIVVVT